MDRNTILKQIKDLIKFSKDLGFKDAKLVDGETIVKVDGEGFEIGKLLQVVTPDGLIPAPAGEHTTEEGVKINVDEAGIITTIEEVKLAEEDKDKETKPATEEMSYDDDKKKEEDMKEEDEDKKKEDMEEEVKKEEMRKKYEVLEKRVAEVEKMMNEMLPIIKESAEFSNVVLSKLNTFVNDTPATMEFTSLKSEYKQMVKDNKTNSYSVMENIKNIRKK